MKNYDAENDRIWVSVLCFLVALAVAGILSVDDYEPRPIAPEFQR